MSTAPEPGSTERTRIRRIPENAVRDREAAYRILDAGRIAHVAVVDDGQPFVLPVAYGRRGDEVVLHGSTGSRLFRLLAEGGPTCLTVTLLDGLVLARSAFESSMNYRSVMVLGSARRLEGIDEVDALRTLSERLIPGRWAQVRPPSRKELAATLTVALPLDECSVKVRTGGPTDAEEDLVDPGLTGLWAGHVPLREVPGIPEADELARDIDVPDYVLDWGRM